MSNFLPFLRCMIIEIGLSLRLFRSNSKSVSLVWMYESLFSPKICIFQLLNQLCLLQLSVTVHGTGTCTQPERTELVTQLIYNWKHVSVNKQVFLRQFFPHTSNSGNVRQVSRPKKRYFTMKEMSHKNSLVLTGKLAPKEEEWSSLQRAVNFQASWNFVIRRTSLQYTGLHHILHIHL